MSSTRDTTPQNAQAQHLVMHQRIKATKERGQAQIIAAVLALIIFALLLVLAIRHFGDAKNSVSGNGATTDVIEMIGNAQKLYHGNASGYTGVTATTLIQNGAVPSDLVNGTNISSPFGTPITVTSATLYTAGDAIAFTIPVPPAACSEFATGIAGSVAKLTVAGSTVIDSTAGTTLNPASLGTACSGTAGASVPFVLTATR